MSFFFRRSVESTIRAVEATPEQLIVTGSAGAYGVDPVDGDTGYVLANQGPRQIPRWTTEKARAYSVAAYRINPMARAILDTYTSFCVGDVGCSITCNDPGVKAVADEFWTDPRNSLATLQEPALRDHMLMGETAWEMMVGDRTGIVRFSPIDVSRIQGVLLDAGNSLWPSALQIASEADPLVKTIVRLDDLTGLRDGEVQFWKSWSALLTDRRGDPFLSPILDELDNYDAVLSNLVDRTALARYMVWDVTVAGDSKQVDEFIKQRGGTHVPRSGTVEVHNDAVTWKPQFAQTGSLEDSVTSRAVLTNIAGGAGLAKTWLAEPDGANRATSHAMAEPVRRRVTGVQQKWLLYQTELVRYAVDRAVSIGRLPVEVPIDDGTDRMVSPSSLVSVRGPEIAAADAQVSATVLFNLAQGLVELVQAGILSIDAAQVAAEKGWETFTGLTYSDQLDVSDADAIGVDDVATDLVEARRRRKGA